jgi:hypothetical protein
MASALSFEVIQLKEKLKEEVDLSFPRLDLFG